MVVCFEATQAPCGGFGTLSNGIINGLKKAGYTISEKNPDVLLAYGVDTEVREVRKRHPNTPLIYYTVWESSKYPEHWVKTAQEMKVDLILTAAEYTKQSIIDSGWKGRVEVWHHGIDDVWQYRERKDDDIFTFIHYNAYEWRKGWDLVLGAFLKEFQTEEDVRLLFLARQRDYANWLIPGNQNLDRPISFRNVEEKLGYFSREELANLIGSADVGVFPVHGEGWFLPATECVAQGLPVIMPNQMAMAEQWNAGCIDVELDGYINVSPRYPGYMIQPSVDDLQKKMRWCYNNKDKCKEMGKAGSVEVHKRFSWDKIIKDLEVYLKLIGEK